MRLKTTLFLFITFFYFSQVEAQSCNADFQTVGGVAVLELTEKVPSGYRNESISGATGGRAVTYRGSNNFRRPGNVTTYTLRVNSTGTYRVQWRNKISIIATNGAAPNTEHNDSWLKINGSDFYGQRGSSRVYPNGSGKSPIARGDSANGFMKIFTNSVNWSWVTKTNDGGGHDIFVTFNQTGTYNVQIGGRSDGHTIDRIVLYRSGVSTSSATSTSRAQTTCSGGGTPPPPPPPPADNNAPTVSITSPSNGQTFDAGSNVTVNLSANDSDGSIQKHEIFVNNSKVDTDGTSYSPYVLRNIQPGNYAIRALVTDNGGKTASQTINISVGNDTTPPPPPADNNPPSVAFTNLSNGQSFTAGTNVPVRLSASDSDGTVTRHQIFVNGTLVDTDGTSYTPHILGSIQPGNYEIQATVTDNGGKFTSETVSISVGSGTTPPPPPPSGDNAAPAVSFTNLSNGSQVAPGSTVSVGVSASDSDGSVVKYQVFVNGLLVDTDGSNYTPHPIRNIGAGDYEIKVTVTDNDGATASSTVNISAGSGTPPPPQGSGITFNLIDAASNTNIGDLVNGASISSSKTQGINIRVNAPAASQRVGIELYRNGAPVKIGFENFAPYAVFGDRSGNYFSANLASGSYRLIAAAYATATSGSVIDRNEITFTVGAASGKSAFLFPNPVQADGKVSVRLPEGASGSYDYSISNALGVQVESGTFDASSRDVQLSLPNVGRQVQGVYYMTLSTKGSRETIPLIKE